MSNYRRYRVPGGSYFFTLVTCRRAPLFEDATAREILGTNLRKARRMWPFHIDAIVLLPDHLHAMWTLPPGDVDYSRRWGWIKKEFTAQWLDSGGEEQPVSLARRRRRRRGVWQPRFWEHTLRDENDFERHFDYIHYNPVKHGYVRCPIDWPYSSFHRWLNQGVYERDWGCSEREMINLNDLDQTAIE